MNDPSDRGAPPARPAPLTVAASLVAVEGVVLVGYGVLLLASVHRSRLAMGVTTPVFFLAYGAALVFCAWALGRLHSWARAPVVLAQLLQIGIAWSFYGGSSTTIAVVIAVVAVLILVGVFHPASLAALEPRE